MRFSTTAQRGNEKEKVQSCRIIRVKKRHHGQEKKGIDDTVAVKTGETEMPETARFSRKREFSNRPIRGQTAIDRAQAATDDTTTTQSSRKERGGRGPRERREGLTDPAVREQVSRKGRPGQHRNLVTTGIWREMSEGKKVKNVPQ